MRITVRLLGRGGTARAFGLSLLIALAGPTAATAEEGVQFQDTGPLRIRDQFLLNMGFLAFDPTPADVLAKGAWQVDVVMTATNTFAHSSAVDAELEKRTGRQPLTLEDLRRIGGEGSHIFQLDGEVYRTGLWIRRGLRPGTQIEILVPVLSFQGGALDGLVEGFHSTFGLTQAGRPGVPRGSYLVYLRGRGRELFVDEAPGSGLGDLVLGAKQSLLHEDARAKLSLEGLVKVPTGSTDNLFGSGSLDVGLQLLGTRYFAHGCLHGSLGLLHLGPSERLGTSAQTLASTMLAYEQALGSTTSAVLQLTASQSPFRSLDLSELSQVSYQASLGLKKGLGKGDTVLFLAFTENLVHFDNTADVGLHAGVTHNF